MATLVLNAYSKAYPSITNRIRASIYLQSDPQAFIASIVNNSPHPARTWSFPGLPRQNYGFSLDEIDSSDAVVTNLALFDVVPGELEDELCRDDEQIRVGTTPGFNDGDSSIFFDGVSGRPDYIGWEIVPSELTGRGILAKGIDYTWDAVTGEFALIQTGDQFYNNGVWNIHFNCISQTQGNSFPTVFDFGVLFKTSDYLISYTDFGKRIICEPSGYIELTLPPIATVPQGRKLMIECGGSGLDTVKVISQDASIMFLRGNLFLMSNEQISVYKFERAPGVFEWRAMDASGQFNSCGQIVSEDLIQTDVFNKQLLDGTLLPDTCRLYQEIVLNLPLAQVVSYASWATGNNKYFYSLSDSGFFHVPDRRDLFERATKSGTKAGDYQAESVGDLGTLNIQVRDGSGGSGTGSLLNTGFSGQDNAAGWLNNDTGAGPKYISISKAPGSETRPKNFSINKYVLL